MLFLYFKYENHNDSSSNIEIINSFDSIEFFFFFVIYDYVSLKRSNL